MTDRKGRENGHLGYLRLRERKKKLGGNDDKNQQHVHNALNAKSIKRKQNAGRSCHDETKYTTSSVFIDTLLEKVNFQGGVDFRHQSTHTHTHAHMRSTRDRKNKKVEN